MPGTLLALVEPAVDTASATGNSWGWVGTALQLLWVLFLFALVLFLAYFTTRIVGRRFAGGGGRYLRVIDSVPLGQHRAVSLVEVSGDVYCVGVTDHGVTLLGRLERDTLTELTPEPGGPPPLANPWTGMLTGFGDAARDAFGQISGRFHRSPGSAGAVPAGDQPAADQLDPGEGEFADRIREQIERLRKIGEHDQP